MFPVREYVYMAAGLVVFLITDEIISGRIIAR